MTSIAKLLINFIFALDTTNEFYRLNGVLISSLQAIEFISIISFLTKQTRLENR